MKRFVAIRVFGERAMTSASGSVRIVNWTRCVKRLQNKFSGKRNDFGRIIVRFGDVDGELGNYCALN